MRTARDATLGMPSLILPSIQVNIRAGEMPAAEANALVRLSLGRDSTAAEVAHVVATLPRVIARIRGPGFRAGDL